MINTEELQSINILELFNKERFLNGLVCPHCHSKLVVKDGKYNKKQRYLCNSCKKTFSDFTNTPLSMTHFIHKWPIFIKSMLEGDSLRKAEKTVGVSYVTLFYWRHKLLNAIKKNKKDTLKGEIQADDICMSYSAKGSKSTLRRNTRHRGARTKYLLSDNVCVVFAADSLKSRISNVVLKRNLNKKDIDEFLGKLVNKKSVICTNIKPVYVAFCKYRHLKHYRIINADKNGVHNISKVKDYIWNFLHWILRFNGVSTKHLPNYLFWHKFLNIIDFDVTLNSVNMMIKEMVLGNLNQTNAFICQE